MADLKGLFDKSLRPSGWFDVTLDASGWFSSEVGSNGVVATIISPTKGTLVTTGKSITIIKSSTVTIENGFVAHNTKFNPTIVIGGNVYCNTGHVLVPSINSEIITNQSKTISPTTCHTIGLGKAPTILQPISILAKITRVSLEIPYSSKVRVVVAPTSGHITYTGLQPSLAVLEPVSVSPGKATSVIAGKQPSVSKSVTLAPGSGHITVAGKQPPIFHKTDITTVGTGHIVTIGKQPTVEQEASVSITPITAHRAAAGKSIVIFAGTTVNTVGTAHRVTLGKQSSISQSKTIATITAHEVSTVKAITITQLAAQTVSTGTAHRIALGKQASITQTFSQTIAPSKTNRLYVGGQPGVTQNAAQVVLPDTGHRTSLGKVASISKVITIATDSAHRVSLGKQPSITHSTNVSALVGHKLSTGKLVTITQLAAQTVSPGTAHRVAIGKLPTIVSNTTIVVGRSAIVVVGKQPSVSNIVPRVLSPGKAATIRTGKTPTISKSVTIAIGKSITEHTVKVPTVSQEKSISTSSAHIRTVCGQPSFVKSMSLDAVTGSHTFNGKAVVIDKGVSIDVPATHKVSLGHDVVVYQPVLTEEQKNDLVISILQDPILGAEAMTLLRSKLRYVDGVWTLATIVDIAPTEPIYREVVRIAPQLPAYVKRGAPYF